MNTHVDDHTRRGRARRPQIDPVDGQDRVVGVHRDVPLPAVDANPEDDAMAVTHEEIATVTCWRCGFDIEPAPDSVVSADGSCPDCALQQACQGLGHVWAPWTTIGPSLSGRWPGGRARYCRICTHGEYDPPPAA